MDPIKKKVEKEGCKKKEMITVEVKKEIIEMHEQGMRVADIARFYNKSTSTICTVLKKKEEIKGLDAAKGVTRVSKRRPRVLEDVEKLLLVWINEKQQAGEHLNDNFICEKAKVLYTDLVSKLPVTSTENDEGFKASRGWFDNFKRRSGIFNAGRYGEAASFNADATETFAAELQNMMPNQVLKKRKFNEDSSQPGTSSMADCDVPSAVNISMSALVATWVEKLNVTNPQQMKFAKKFIHEILSLAAQGKLHENSIHIDEDENSIDSNTVYDTQADQSEDETLELDAMDDIIDIKEELIEYPMMTENDTETENLNKTLPIEYNNPECSTLSLEIKQERDHTSDEDHSQTLNIDKHCKEKSDDIYMIDQSKDDFYYFGLSVGNKLRKINDLDEQQRYSCEKNILDALYNTLIEISSNRSNIEPTDIAKTHNIPKLVEVSA